jgi:uncharacterized NAD-dependent epimerase/dehydratase family protein
VKPLQLPQPYLLFLGDARDPTDAKTAFGLRDWAAERCIGECSLEQATVSTGLRRFTPLEARQHGAEALVIAVAPLGGKIAASWVPVLQEALQSGLDLISGLHTALEEIPGLAPLAEQHGRRLFNVRRPPAGIPVASGRKRSGKRLLTVGTDCALGKKYTALALTRSFNERHYDAEFRATGQTGIMIAGAGIPIDAVVSDFVAGAAEILSPAAAADHWDIVEGQGSLFHPSFAGVSLGLLHGTQPDVLVMCHEAGREAVCDFPELRLPSLEEAIDLNLQLARRTNPAVRCAGVSLNTGKLTEAQASELLSQERRRLNLPFADPMRGGAEFEELVSACLEGSSR